MRMRAILVTISTLACLTLSACENEPGQSHASSADSKTPVITTPEEAKDYPWAGVEGRLELRNGCLVLRGNVVFWPYGATWDEDANAVVFKDAPPFEDAASAPVGAVFSGGGAWYPADADFGSWGPEFANLIEGCQDATNTKAVVYAYPATPR